MNDNRQQPATHTESRATWSDGVCTIAVDYGYGAGRSARFVLAVPQPTRLVGDAEAEFRAREIRAALAAIQAMD
jgi:hypothetical protein